MRNETINIQRTGEDVEFVVGNRSLAAGCRSRKWPTGSESNVVRPLARN